MSLTIYIYSKVTFGVSLSLGEGGSGAEDCSVGEGAVSGASTALSLKMDFSFFMLCVGAIPVSFAKLKYILSLNFKLFSCNK